MRRKVFPVLLLVCASVLQAQISNNEKLSYSASYNMAGLMTQLAQVTMQTEPIKTSKKTYLHLSIEAATFSKWDHFFKIRDFYESFVDPTSLKPAMYKRNITEGNYQKTEKYIFSGTQIHATSQRPKRSENKSSFSVGASTIDVVSMVYKLRTINFEGLKEGQIISFTTVFDQKEYPVQVKMMGKEVINAGCFRSKPCYKLSVAAKTDKLKGKDKNLIWITSDSQHIPVMIRFSIPVGTGQLTIKSVSAK